MRRRQSGFEIFLRTGRRVADDSDQLETKFNPWHDPEDGRFTFARQGRYFGGGSARSGEGGGTARVAAGSSTRPATTRAPAQAPTPKPKIMRPATLRPSRPMRGVTPNAPSGSFSSATVRKPGPNQDSATLIRNPRDALAQIGREMGTAQSSLRPIPGYSEAGASSWRASNDRAFVDAANRFNSQHGLKSSDPKYIDPLLLKAWAMVESGGTKSAFLRDPLQVNNPGDWKAPKPQVTGLAKGQPMTPAISVEAALKWLEFRGYIRDKQGRAGTWIGIERAIQRYNARTDPHPSGVPFRVWYARQILTLYGRAKKSQ